MPRKLKVFRAHFGFYDEIVAAPSQKAALEAWGVGPQEFRHGFAAITGDKALVDAALKQPGVVLRREFGSKGAFEIEATIRGVKGLSAKERMSRAAQRRKAEESARRAAEREAERMAERERQAKLRDITRREAELAAEKRALRKPANRGREKSK